MLIAGNMTTEVNQTFCLPCEKFISNIIRSLLSIGIICRCKRTIDIRISYHFILMLIEYRFIRRTTIDNDMRKIFMNRTRIVESNRLSFNSMNQLIEYKHRLE
jgi:hypothetical protein